MENALTISDLNTTVNHEPRIAHRRLATALGFSQVHKMGHLVERHIEALQRFGEVSSTVDETGPKGGRPGKTYWLNKKQALYLCTKSETANATEATIQMVEVFDAYLQGKVPASKPKRISRQRPEPSTPRLALPAPEMRREPFSAYFDLLQDLKAAVSSARVRVMLGETGDFGLALEEVLVDHIKVLNGRSASGKTLLDWDLRRTGGTVNSYREKFRIRAVA